MLKSLKWKFIIYAAITLFAILLFLPTVTSQLPPWYMKVIPTEKIHLGLDLQGGMHLILEAESDKAVESYVERIKNNLKDDLKERGIPAGKVEREKKDQIVLEVSGEKGKVGKTSKRTLLHDARTLHVRDWRRNMENRPGAG